MVSTVRFGRGFKLRRVQQVLGEQYHACGPLKSIQKRLDSAIHALERWPVATRVISKATRMSAPIPKGTLVWLKPMRCHARVYRHDISDDFVQCYGQGGFYSALRFEVSIPRNQSLTENLVPMRLYLPYGKWSCVDGTEVLFNRDYCPIWARMPSGKAITLDPDTWISYTGESVHYYDDGNRPWDNKATLEKCMGILKSWGVQNQHPRVLQMFDAIVEKGGDFDDLKEKNMDKRFPALLAV